MIKSLVWSGGAVYLITFIGIYSILFPKLSHLQEIIGVSSGAIISLITTLQFDPLEIASIIESYQLDRLIQFEYNSLGLSSNQPLFYFIGSILLAAHLNPNITFQELYQHTGRHLRIGVTNLTIGRFEIIDHLSHPTMHVQEGILMSCLFPGLFTPVIYNNHVYMDGGITCNYPMRHISPQYRHHALGIILLDHIRTQPIHHMIDVTLRTVELLLYEYQRLHIDSGSKTIILHTLPHISILKFNLSIQEKEELYQHGRTAAQQWIAANLLQHWWRNRRNHPTHSNLG
jgi:predicted acylesterase/phospholipase RssA